MNVSMRRENGKFVYRLERLHLGARRRRRARADPGNDERRRARAASFALTCALELTQ